MPVSRTSLFVLAASSCLLGLVLAVFPVSYSYSGLRPELLCLLVIYWVTAAPQHFGIGFAWCLGFAQDVVEGLVWGAHALGLSLVAYICFVAYQRMKNYSVWHQTLWIFVLVGLHQVLVNWIQSLAGYRSTPLALLLSATVTALCWPPLFVVLSRLRSSYRAYS